MTEIREPKNMSWKFRQYFIILNNTKEKDTDFNYSLDSDGIFNGWYERDFTEDRVTVIHDCGCKTDFYIANACDARYVTKNEYTESLAELTNILKRYYPNFNGYKFSAVKEYDIPYTNTSVTFKDDPLYDIGYSINPEAFFDWLDKHNIKLEDFLTSKKYVVIVEEKRYSFFKELFLKGYINKDVMENYDEITEIIEEATKEDERYVD